MTFLAGQKLRASQLNALISPRAALRLNSATSIANATFTKIALNVEDFDSHDGHSLSLNTSRYTCQVAGDLIFSANVEFAINSTGARGATWYLNGSELPNAQTLYPATAVVNSSVAIGEYGVTMAVGDFVELGPFQSSGGALNVNSVRLNVKSFVS